MFICILYQKFALILKGVDSMNTMIDEVCGCEMVLSGTGKMKPGDIHTEERHGMKGTPQYNRWKGMKSRCMANTVNKKYYKDRGIGVCIRWVKSFADYYRDIGDKPFESASMDRSDNNRGYCPHNTKWATKKEQSNNRRAPKLSRKRFGIEIDGRIFASYKTKEDRDLAMLTMREVEYDITR